MEALQRNREFIEQYRDARTQWLEGHPATFPAGTYWLRMFAGVQVEPVKHIEEPLADVS